MFATLDKVEKTTEKSTATKTSQKGKGSTSKKSSAKKNPVKTKGVCWFLLRVANEYSVIICRGMLKRLGCCCVLHRSPKQNFRRSSGMMMKRCGEFYS